MLKKSLILSLFLIVPFLARSQDSLVTVRISDLRKASLLIIEGDECKATLPIKDAQIKKKQAVISELELIRKDLESINDIKTSQLVLKDSIIFNKDRVIESKDKQIKKHKLISIGLGTVLLYFLAFL